MTRRKLFIVLSMPTLLQAQVPNQFPSGAIQDNGTNSMYNSSVDNLVNSQQGEFIAGTISQDLAGQASQAYESCEDPNATQDPDCLLSSTLLGMKELTDQSATSFNAQAGVAQSNVCVFAARACGAEIPNPYSSLRPVPPLTAAELEELIQNLNRRGLSIQPRTGIILNQGQSLINPNDPQSLKKTLGESQSQKLMTLLKSLEKKAIQLASKLTRPQAIKKMGLPDLINLPSLAKKTNENSRLQMNQNNQNPEVKRPEAFVTSYLGEPVGIGQASLFKIIKKRYGIKIGENTFLPTK